MKALRLRVDPLASCLYVPVISLAVMTAPISFNGLGVRESLGIVFFGMAGYSPEQALGLAMISLLGILGISVMGGALVLTERWHRRVSPPGDR